MLLQVMLSQISYFARTKNSGNMSKMYVRTFFYMNFTFSKNIEY